MSAHDGSYRPQARIDGLVTTETGSDLLIYDTERNELHTLNHAAAAVWRAADGSKSVADIAVETALDSTTVDHALQQSTISNLLVNGVKQQEISGRRRFLKKAAIVSIPAIVSVSVPLAKAAASFPEICGCNHPSECNSEAKKQACGAASSCKNAAGQTAAAHPDKGPFWCYPG